MEEASNRMIKEMREAFAEFRADLKKVVVQPLVGEKLRTTTTELLTKKERGDEDEEDELDEVCIASEVVREDLVIVGAATIPAKREVEHQFTMDEGVEEPTFLRGNRTSNGNNGDGVSDDVVEIEFGGVLKDKPGGDSRSIVGDFDGGGKGDNHHFMVASCPRPIKREKFEGGGAGASRSDGGPSLQRQCGGLGGEGLGED